MLTLPKARTIAGRFGRLRLEFHGPKFAVQCLYTRDMEEGALALGLIFGTLYISSERHAAPSWQEYVYGFDLHHGALWLHWGKDDSRHIRSIRPQGDWFYDMDAERKIERGTHPYTYRWKFRDEVQHVTAKVTEDHREWVWRIGKVRLPFIRKRSDGLWCEFSEEMGDQRNSWKGGIIGAGADIQPGESWQDAYARMQWEKNFCRNK